MANKTEKKIEKELNKAEREHDKAMIAEGKGHLHSAEKHENRAINHENRAGGLGHNTHAAGNVSGQQHYAGLNYPYMGASAHPTYGYHRLPRDKKAERFEAKAVEWERRGNATKAQKNRSKALRLRQRDQPGFVPTANPQPYYADKANRFDQRALRYQQMGMIPQAQRYQQRALRTRSKHGVTGNPMAGGMMHGAPMTGGMMHGAPMMAGGMIPGASERGYVGPIVPYTGLNHPMNGANQHPTFGYPRLSSAQKAQRYEQKAALWAQKGNMAKSQKNKDKAMRYQQMGQAGYAKPTRTQDYYLNRATNFDQKARQYQQMGRTQEATRAQQRAQRIRTKHNIPAGTGIAGAGLAGAALGANRGMMGQQPIGQHQGLNFPYTGASAHPKYGYQKLGRDQKIQRLNAKAAEWERRGNMAKAQKNREKAARYQQRGQPGYVRPQRAQDYYPNRANAFDQKAARYQQMGMMPQAQRYQGRAQRIRAKHNVPAGANQGMMGNHIGQYQGLNLPYTGATAHPQYGYQKLNRDQKIQRYEQKAALYEQRKNMAKAQKNRDKVARYRQMGQPGYVRPQRAQDYYPNRASLFDQKAARYQQMGMMPQAQRYQGRAQRIRAKHNVPAGLGMGQHTHGQTWTTGQTIVGPLIDQGTVITGTSMPGARQYQGLNLPYTGAVAHPQYGYMRLPHDQKAARFLQKAQQYEQRGNMAKAQKNREKAARYQARNQPGYVKPVRPQQYYNDRANLFDQRALQYQQMGMQPQYQRYAGRSKRIRSKHNVPMTAGATPMNTGARVI